MKVNSYFSFCCHPWAVRTLGHMLHFKHKRGISLYLHMCAGFGQSNEHRGKWWCSAVAGLNFKQNTWMACQHCGSVNIRVWTQCLKRWNARLCPGLVLLSCCCPPLVLLLSFSCPPLVLLLSSSCPSLVLLLSSSCPPLVLFLSLVLQLSLLLPSSGRAGETCVLVWSSWCPSPASSGHVCLGVLLLSSCHVENPVFLLSFVQVCLSCLSTLSALLSPPCPGLVPSRFLFLHSLVWVCFRAAMNATVILHWKLERGGGERKVAGNHKQPW